MSKEIDIDAEIEHIESLIRHIDNVRNACRLLARKLISLGELDFARILIANSLIHDESKFKGMEWKDLRHGVEESKLKVALIQHTATNPHHPEHWGGISEMPEIYLAEICCDWYARSAEAGTDLRDWIKNEASNRFGFSVKGKTYKRIKRYVDLLLDPKMKPIKGE